MKPKPFSEEFFKQAGAKGGKRGGKTRTAARLKALEKARKALAKKRRTKGGKG